MVVASAAAAAVAVAAATAAATAAAAALASAVGVAIVAGASKYSVAVPSRNLKPPKGWAVAAAALQPQNVLFLWPFHGRLRSSALQYDLLLLNESQRWPNESEQRRPLHFGARNIFRSLNFKRWRIGFLRKQTTHPKLVRMLGSPSLLVFL